MLIGVFFVTVFTIMAKTVVATNLTVTSVTSKMSMVIPSLIGVFALHETTTIAMWFGLVLAVISVYRLIRLRSVLFDTNLKVYY